MARRSSFPRYRRQQGRTGARAFVELNGRRVYLGSYGSPESREAYDRTIAEWLANRRRAPRREDPAAAPGITVVELLARWGEHAKEWYRRPDGSPTSEVGCYKSALSIVRRRYGRTEAKQFDAIALKAVREAMIGEGWTRYVINKQVGRVRRVFRWALSEGMIPPEVMTSLDAVQSLQAGRCKAKESEAIRPVADDVIEATLKHVPEVVADMARVQLLSAMRPGEVCALRPKDIDMSGTTWLYVPPAHKMSYRGRPRQIAIGPKAQAVLRNYIADRPINEPCFSPADSEVKRREAARKRRVTPAGQGNGPGTNKSRNPKRPPKAQYDTTSYARAVARACLKAGVEPWHPNQLRHSAATTIRRVAGLETARCVLGHAVASITEQFYAEADLQKATEVIQRIG